MAALQGAGANRLLAAEMAAIHSIAVVTPAWEGQTNPDGSGLFFEIVRRVYEPADIKMTFSFAPWKRAQKLLAAQKADAMLCVWREDALSEGQLIPYFPLTVEHTAAVFRKDRIGSWSGRQTLDGRTAVWLRGYDFHTSQLLAGIRLREWIEVDDPETAWKLLSQNRYEIYIDALIDLERYIASQRVDMAPFRMEILWRENTYVAFAATEKSRRLMEIYDHQIQELFKSGELKKLHEKWGARFYPEAWQTR